MFLLEATQKVSLKVAYKKKNLTDSDGKKYFLTLFSSILENALL